MASTYISSITFEQHPTGFGIGHASPRISWRFSSDGGDLKNWIQQSYELQIGRQDNVDAKIYHVHSSGSVLVPWPSDALQSRESAWVKVRSHGEALDAAGNVTKESTEWSSPATVEAALLCKNDWTAQLTASTLLAKKNEPMHPMLFRKVFCLPEGVEKVLKARLHITAHGVYEAFINGHRVGDEEMAPGWTSYNYRLLYQTFDVTESLLAGKPNVIGVQVAEGWFAGRLAGGNNRCLYGQRMAFLAQLEVLFSNGHTYTLSSNDTWKSHQSGTTRSEIYDGEDYDSRKEQTGWNSDPDLDVHSWVSTDVLPFPTARLLASDTPPVRIKEELPAVKIFKSKSGKALIDFGQNLVGKLNVRLPIAALTDLDEHKLSFSHAEVLEHDELGTRPLRGAKPVDSVILSRTQPLTWSPKFTFHGFRYVQIDGWPTETGLPSQDDIKALVLHSDMRRTGWFFCSDPLLSQLHENVVWSTKGNFLSVPMDCPQRDERLGWTGDIQVFSPSANFIYDTKGFLENWLDDVAAEQLQEHRHGIGIPGVVVPDVFKAGHPLGGPQSVWHDVTVLTPWDLFTSSGDTQILRRQYESMKAWVDKGMRRGPDGLWDQNKWQFGDWLDPAAPPSQPALGRTDTHLVADAYLFRVLDIISKVSSLLGETEDSVHYSKDALRVKNAFQHQYVTPLGLVVGDTQTAYSLAICFGLLDQPNHILKSASRLCNLVHTAGYRIATGFVGTPLIAHALSDTGNHQLAYRMLLERGCPSWLYPITMGATTIWERWDSMLPDGTINPGKMTSFNHYALGSVVNWLHKNVGGISPLEPGWQTIQVRPVPGGTVTSANVVYESPYGRIECSWKINETNRIFELAVVIPPNSKAKVIMPCDLKTAEEHREEKSVVIGSGKYQFSCPYEPAEWPPKPEFARSLARAPE